MTDPNLLMVCYFYPPAATGVRRLLSLARDLPAHGWHPMVVCCDHTAGMGWDESPFEEGDIARIPVVRTESLDPYRLMERWRSRRGEGVGPVRTAASLTGAGGRSRALMSFLRKHVFVPDDRQGWVRFATRAGLEAIRTHPIRAIYSSNYPQSAHVAALRIKERTGIPWLADFRDGWTESPILPAPGNLLNRMAQNGLETKVARMADRVVTVSPPITRHLQVLRGEGKPIVETIYNGFDPLPAPSDTTEPLHPGRVTILYAGTFFANRSPDHFLKALSHLLERSLGLRERIRIRFRCALDDSASALIARLGLNHAVEVMPPVPFAQIRAEQQRADGFLLVVERSRCSEIMVSQKIFEYLGARKPIFALVPPGAAQEVLEETGGATICTSVSIEEAAGMLGDFLGKVLGGTHPLAERERLAAFERSRQSGRIAGLLDAMAMHGGSSITGGSVTR